MKFECTNCHITLEKDEIELKYNNRCPMCGKANTFIKEYIMDIKRISSDESFIQAMVKLHDEDPIEYQLKLQQLKNAQEQQKQVEEKKQEECINNCPHCPTCGSSNLAKVSSFSKIIDSAVWGIGGAQRYKTFHCNNCGYEWQFFFQL